MPSFWAPVVAALITAALSAIGIFVQHRQLRAAERREGEAMKRAEEAERRRLVIELQRNEFERERDTFARENDFYRRLEGALLRAHSDDPTQRDSGLIDLVHLRDRVRSSPQLAELAQAHIDRIHQTRVGKWMVGIVDALSDKIAGAPRLAPSMGPSASRLDAQLLNLAQQVDAGTEHLDSLIREGGERFRAMGKALIEGEEFHNPG